MPITTAILGQAGTLQSLALTTISSISLCAEPLLSVAREIHRRHQDQFWAIWSNDILQLTILIQGEKRMGGWSRKRTAGSALQRIKFKQVTPKKKLISCLLPS